MPGPELPLNADESLRAFTPEEVGDMAIRRIGVRDHTHVTWSFGPDGSSCTRRFACDWDQKFQALLRFVGAAKTYADSGGDLRVSRLLPQQDPDFPGWYCTKCEVMPWRFTGEIDDPDPTGRSEALPAFTRAELRCVYELCPWELKEDEDTVEEADRYVTWPGFPGAEIGTEVDYIGLPGSTLHYTTADGTSRPKEVPIPYPVGFTEGKGTFRIIWRRVPFDAWGPSATLTQRVKGTAADRGMVGSLNKTTFRGYPPLTLQLRNVEQRLLPDATGLGYSWDIAYVISDKPVPFGHLGYYFHQTDKTVPDVSGYYQALRPPAGATTKPAGSIGDRDSIFHVREFADLFVVGDV